MPGRLFTGVDCCSGPGVVGFANSGKNTNTSQFYMTLAAAPKCDGKHVVIGRVVEGLDILKRIGESLPVHGISQRTRLVMQLICTLTVCDMGSKLLRILDTAHQPCQYTCSFLLRMTRVEMPMRHPKQNMNARCQGVRAVWCQKACHCCAERSHATVS